MSWAGPDSEKQMPTQKRGRAVTESRESTFRRKAAVIASVSTACGGCGAPQRALFARRGASGEAPGKKTAAAHGLFLAFWLLLPYERARVQVLLHTRASPRASPRTRPLARSRRAAPSGGQVAGHIGAAP